MSQADSYRCYLYNAIDAADGKGIFEMATTRQYFDDTLSRFSFVHNTTIAARCFSHALDFRH